MCNLNVNVPKENAIASQTTCPWQWEIRDFVPQFTHWFLLLCCCVFPSSLFVTPPIPPISPKTFLCCLFFTFSLFSRSLSQHVFYIHTNSFSFVPSPSLSLDKSLAGTLWFHYPFLVLEYERSCDNHRCHVMTQKLSCHGSPSLISWDFCVS